MLSTGEVGLWGQQWLSSLSLPRCRLCRSPQPYFFPLPLDEVASCRNVSPGLASLLSEHNWDVRWVLGENVPPSPSQSAAAARPYPRAHPVSAESLCIFKSQ